MSDDGTIDRSIQDDFDHSQATVVFVIGLLSVVMCQILGPVALLMGNKYRAACAEVGEEPVLLCITLGILLLYFGFFCVYMIFVVFFVAGMAAL